MCILLGAKVYQGRESNITGVKLQTGVGHTDYNVYVIVKAAVETGAYVTATVTAQVPVNVAVTVVLFSSPL